MLNALDINNYGILEIDIFGTKGRIRIDLVKHSAELFDISTKGLVYSELKKRRDIIAKKEN